MDDNRIYLDNNATTPLDESVKNAVMEVLNDAPGNAASIHSFGQRAKQRLTAARQSIATALNVKPGEIIFNSGGTEGLNTLIRGICSQHPSGHVITSDLEHAATFGVLKDLAVRGTDVSFLSPGALGAVSSEMIEESIRPETSLITLMGANNETGVVTDIEGIARIAEERGIPFVIDAVGLLGKTRFSIPKGISAMIFCGHKFYAPQGVGFLFVRHGTKFQPLVSGGSQEQGRRPGTENLSGIVGMAQAVNLVTNDIDETVKRVTALRDRLESKLKEELKDVVVNAEDLNRIGNTSNISFLGVDGESLLMNLDLAGIAASHGSACSAGALEPSRVLINMGVPYEHAASAVRFSLSRFTTESAIDQAVKIIVDVVQRMRNMVRSSQKS